MRERYLSFCFDQLLLESGDVLLKGLQLTSIVIAQVGERFLFFLFDQILKGFYGIRYINWITVLESKINQRVHSTEMQPVACRRITETS